MGVDKVFCTRKKFIIIQPAASGSSDVSRFLYFILPTSLFIYKEVHSPKYTEENLGEKKRKKNKE